jgi:inhibitor of KinA sporulation pathway (predicted exonuclease)
MKKNLIITLELTIEDPNGPLDEVRICEIKALVEEATQGSFAKVMWNFGNYLDAEVKEVQVVESYGF